MKKPEEGGFEPLYGFCRNVFTRKRVKHCFFLTLNITIYHIFPENAIQKISQVIQETWEFSHSKLTISLNLHFLTFPCCKKNYWDQHITDNVSIFLLSPSLNRLFSNCYIDTRLVFLERQNGVKLTPAPSHLPP